MAPLVDRSVNQKKNQLTDWLTGPNLTNGPSSWFECSGRPARSTNQITPHRKLRHIGLIAQYLSRNSKKNLEFSSWMMKLTGRLVRSIWISKLTMKSTGHVVRLTWISKPTGEINWWPSYVARFFMPTGQIFRPTR